MSIVNKILKALSPWYHENEVNAKIAEQDKMLLKSNYKASEATRLIKAYKSQDEILSRRR